MSYYSNRRYNPPADVYAASTVIGLNTGKINRIISGSCTPACDLVVMVDDGEITAAEATAALKARGHNIADVHSAAAFERDEMRRLDC